MKIMVTGFEPFLNNEINPTKEILELLPPTMKGHEVIKICLPVEYGKSFEIVKDIIEKDKPDIIINLGLAANRKAVTPERVAININHSKHPDNKGALKTNKPISDNGKNAYFTLLPLDQIIDRLESKSIPVEISNTAGTYVCNDLMYRVLEYVDQNRLEIVTGFVHIPQMDNLNSDKESFSLPLDTLLEAVIDIIKTCI